MTLLREAMVVPAMKMRPMPFFGNLQCVYCAAIPSYGDSHTMRCWVSYRVQAVLEESSYGEPEDELDVAILAHLRASGYKTKRLPPLP